MCVYIDIVCVDINEIVIILNVLTEFDTSIHQDHLVGRLSHKFQVLVLKIMFSLPFIKISIYSTRM